MCVLSPLMVVQYLLRHKVIIKQNYELCVLLQILCYIDGNIYSNENYDCHIVKETQLTTYIQVLVLVMKCLQLYNYYRPLFVKACH